MTGIFLTVLKMNLSAVWCMLAVIVLRFALRKVPKWTHCLLWAVAAVQLILPVTIQSAFSLLPQESSVGSTVQYGGMVALCLCTVPNEIPKNMVYVPANQSDPVPGEIVDQWIVFERNGISLEKLKCCSCGRGTPSR